MGRPKICDEPRVTTAIRLPTSLRGQLQEAAAERDVSVNHLVTRAVSDYLARLGPLDSQADERRARPSARKPRRATR